MMRAEAAASTLDGNAVAGMMSEVFAGDVTTLVVECACGRSAPLAETTVELDERGAIVRCRSCTHTLITLLRAEGRMRVAFGSLRALMRD